jgi:hypothetical protein
MYQALSEIIAISLPRGTPDQVLDISRHFIQRIGS